MLTQPLRFAQRSELIAEQINDLSALLYSALAIGLCEVLQSNACVFAVRPNSLLRVLKESLLVKQQKAFSLKTLGTWELYLLALFYNYH